MKIYNYHPDTFEFINESVADPSPLEENVWLIPAHATNVAPPSVSAGSVAVFSNGGWIVKAIEYPPTPEPAPEIDPQIEINAKARMYLYQTDWYIIRKTETGAEIPAEILEARAAARATIVE